jgi:hypothetical protein
MAEDRVYEAHNRFAESLASRIRDRSLGREIDAERLVGIAPEDYILTGFLTPVTKRASRETEEDGGEPDPYADNLPQDNDFERTAAGFEWLVPSSALGRSLVISVAFSCSIFVRRLPERDEQVVRGSWKSAQSNEGRESAAVPVWTQHKLGPFVTAVPLDQLKASRRLDVSLGPQLQQAWSDVANSLGYLYPSSQRSALLVPEAVITDDPTYDHWRQGLGGGPRTADWNPVIDARMSRTAGATDKHRVELRVVNRTPDPHWHQGAAHDANLYDVALTATVPTEAHALLTFEELPNDYRYDRGMPVAGINSHACWSRQGDDWVFELEAVPVVKTQRLEPRRLAEAEPTFARLSSDPVGILKKILSYMERYDADAWQHRIDTLSSDAARTDAGRDRARFRRDEIDMFRRGIELLDNSAYPHVQQAFRLMNRVMGEVASTARNTYDSWRLFQIVFIVRNLESLAHREYPELQADATAEVLWFAAGGGKTEAFLGLIVWQILFDRLRGKDIGVTALVRFPLRLLTFQQLQRFARVLALAERLRVAEELGGSQISLGYYVGGDTTPNSIDDERHADFRTHGAPKNLKRLLQCPFCSGQVELRYEGPNRLLVHHCPNPSCPSGGAIPLYIVDDDIYRYLPTVIVSTVDKMALLGFNQRFANLLGRFDLYCPIHGASFRDGNRNRCDAAAQMAKPDAMRPAACGAVDLIHGPFHDPGPSLLVQDELHLLSEDLGTFASHYETAIMALSTTIGQRPWKVVGATATIEKFEKHMWHLYLLPARQFPAPGPAAYESFYYVTNPEKLGRIFMGLVGVKRKHTPSVTRLNTLIYQELQTAREMVDDDLPSALHRYALPSLTASEFNDLLFDYELVLTYVLTRKGGDQVAEAIENRVTRELRDVAPRHGPLVLEMFNGGVEMTHMIESMDLIQNADPKLKPEERVRGLVVTNIIGHGLDVDRFNIMLFAGFTRLVAEYIQASARIGRTFPGLSIFVATPQSERDRSIYERFGKFHEYVDRLVDPSALTRWPEDALLRTVPGILCGYLMGVAAHRLQRRIYTAEQVVAEIGKAGAEVLQEDSVVEWCQEALGADHAPVQNFMRTLRERVENEYSAVVNTQSVPGQRPHNVSTVLNPMRSLRDTDDPGFISLDVAGTRKLQALRRGRGQDSNPLSPPGKD